MIGNRDAPPLAGNIDVAAGTASRATIRSFLLRMLASLKSIGN